MQVQPVVPVPPGGAGLGAGLEQERLDARAAKQRRGGEPRRAGADDHDLVRLHAGVIPSDGARGATVMAGRAGVAQWQSLGLPTR